MSFTGIETEPVLTIRIIGMISVVLAFEFPVRYWAFRETP